MDRQALQRLAKLRNKEAVLLMKNKQYSGSYYLFGYVIECALKACIARSYVAETFPEKKKVLDSHSHNLEQLLKIAQLDSQFQQDSKNNPDLEANWATVKDWNVTSRYETKTKREALDINQSINQRKNGMLVWVQQYW